MLVVIYRTFGIRNLRFVRGASLFIFVIVFAICYFYALFEVFFSNKTFLCCSE